MPLPDESATIRLVHVEQDRASCFKGRIDREEQLRSDAILDTYARPYLHQTSHTSQHRRRDVEVWTVEVQSRVVASNMAQSSVAFYRVKPGK